MVYGRGPEFEPVGWAPRLNTRGLPQADTEFPNKPTNPANHTCRSRQIGENRTNRIHRAETGYPYGPPNAATERPDGRGEPRSDQAKGLMVMVAATQARVSFCARIISGAAIFAAVLTVGGAQNSYADPPAPIVYAKAPSRAANFALENRVELASAADVVDLRPGATRASFGPALPASRYASSSAAFAEPHAGPPYQVDGKWYVPAYEPNYDEVGIASWYGPTFHGKASASGEVFDENALTAAHPTLPIPSLVRVTNLENGRSIVVRLNDRGPFVDDRIIDLSRAAGAALDMHGKGTAKVRVQYVGPAPAEANALPAQPIPVQVSAPINTLPPSPAPYVGRDPLPPLADIPVAAAPSRATEARGYFLQAGSFADLGNAHTLKDKLMTFAPSSVAAVKVNGSDFYRVMVGPWSSREAAVDAQERLSRSGTKAIVVAKLN
jgi:rare lipoprotein A